MEINFFSSLKGTRIEFSLLPSKLNWHISSYFLIFKSKQKEIICIFVVSVSLAEAPQAFKIQ